MWKSILVVLLFADCIYPQDNLTGQSEVTVFENGIYKHKTVVTPQPGAGKSKITSSESFQHPSVKNNNTSVRWFYNDPVSIGNYCEASGNGKYNVVGWNLNNERISLYYNSGSTPLWEFVTDPQVILNFVAISDTGGAIGVSSLHNIFMFNNINNTPVFDFNLTHLPDTGIGTSLDVTSDGSFLVASVSRQDSSTIYGFDPSVNIPVWQFKIIPAATLGGGSVMGVKISGNDSLVIVNTYSEFFVIETFTGQLIYSGFLNGTQTAQGISGDGSVIATIGYAGILRVYRWNGTSYDLMWQNFEPPGAYANWYTAVDVSYDGNYIAAGTLNFVTTSTYNGKIKVFRSDGNGTPEWTYDGCGDEVTAVSFSGSGNILSASTWGSLNNLTNDLYIFKTFSGNVPIFAVNTTGSFYCCSTSNDGRTVIASGKSIHARQFGYGGLMYNIDVDTNDAPSSVNAITSRADDYALYQNYPNPFNPETVVRYSLQKNGFTKLKVYDVTGKEVASLVNEMQNPGSYEVGFNASNLSSGIYYYEIISGDFADTKKMILLK